ncbi:ABC transporter substrate-binding protein [Salinicola lusitanus]|uniref:ABC transporter substrate-binding protein n=1 Tax=Salinicola lusitanus TaxID=1949085 RepID=A0ABZ3CV02_9GAMM
MKTILRYALTLLLLAGMAPVMAAEPRTVVIGGDIGEILAELDATDSLVGRDDTVRHPASLTTLPSVGYLRQLSAESVLSLHPQRLIVSADAAPSETLDQLEASGVELIEIPADKRLESIPDKVRTVAEAVGVPERGEALAQKLAGQIAALDALPPLTDLRGLFLLSHSGMTPMVAGSGTGGDGMMQAVGLTNAFAGFEGYRPVGAEGLVANHPDVVIGTTLGISAVGGESGVWALPGMMATPAGAKHRLLVFDDLALLDFGPRTPQTLMDLRRALEALP